MCLNKRCGFIYEPFRATHLFQDKPTNKRTKKKYELWSEERQILFTIFMVHCLNFQRLFHFVFIL